MITVTDSARNQLLELLKTNNEKSVLLSVNSKGCGGHSYQMHFFDAQDGDEIIPLDEGHSLVLDRLSLIWLIGVQLDFAENGFGSSFTFVNPQEAGRCGCGSSFTTKSCGS